MAYYHICPECGAALDPEEKCDCQLENEKDIDHENDTEKNKHPELQGVQG
jgi:hypothetical protein